MVLIEMDLQITRAAGKGEASIAASVPSSAYNGYNIRLQVRHHPYTATRRFEAVNVVLLAASARINYTRNCKSSEVAHALEHLVFGLAQQYVRCSAMGQFIKQMQMIVCRWHAGGKSERGSTIANCATGVSAVSQSQVRGQQERQLMYATDRVAEPALRYVRGTATASSKARYCRHQEVLLVDELQHPRVPHENPSGPI